MTQLFLSLCLICLLATSSTAETLKLAVTTSFHNSGLAEVLLPRIKTDTDIDVQLLVVGTGQALKLGEAGDVDALLVHAKSAELEFIENGYGLSRVPFMYNDFVIVGPETDPADLAQMKSLDAALGAIPTTKSTFVSRGDDSGTHKKELSLWSNIELNPSNFGDWYRSVGSGMGAALNTAVAMDAHILADRASWLNFKNKQNHKILFEGDPALFNQYSFIAVNPASKPHIKYDLARQLQNWLVSDTAKDLIDGYTLNGEQLFTFNASR